jgi:transcriptional regulator with XRE-family HTH domain
MVAQNPLSQAPPYAIEQALKRLGANLRTARLRRHFTIEEIAQKIGAGRRAIMDAEKGKTTTAIAVYAALLWAYDLLPAMDELANPAKDESGLILAAADGKKRARKSGALDNDF